MPSLDISDYLLAETTPKEKKEKKMKKSKSETLEADSPSTEKKAKKESKLKKRKALDVEADEDRSETSSELGEAVNAKSKSEEKTKKKSKKAKVEQEEEPKIEVKKAEEDPNAVSRFRISEPLKAKLKEKGIESLFSIQAMTFDTILDGSDLVGRARTGQVI